MPLWFSTVSFLVSHSYPEAHLTYENSSYIEAGIPKLPPFSPPTPKSFPILWTGTWKRYVKQIPFYGLPTCFFIHEKLLFNRTDSGQVVLFPILFQSLSMIWARHNQVIKSWFPTEPRCSLRIFLSITFEAANTKWSGWPWDRLSLEALLALALHSCIQ